MLSPKGCLRPERGEKSVTNPICGSLFVQPATTLHSANECSGNGFSSYSSDAVKHRLYHGLTRPRVFAIFLSPSVKIVGMSTRPRQLPNPFQFISYPAASHYSLRPVNGCFSLPAKSLLVSGTVRTHYHNFILFHFCVFSNGAPLRREEG
jgi:hypothetical protein